MHDSRWWDKVLSVPLQPECHTETFNPLSHSCTADWVFCKRRGRNHWSWNPSRCYSPLCVVQQDEHAGATVILETLVMMAVCVANEIIKYGCVNDVQQPRPCIIWRHFLHRLAVTLVILPPEWITDTKSLILMFTDVISPHGTSGFLHSQQYNNLFPWTWQESFLFLWVNHSLTNRWEMSRLTPSGGWHIIHTSYCFLDHNGLHRVKILLLPEINKQTEFSAWTLQVQHPRNQNECASYIKRSAWVCE